MQQQSSDKNKSFSQKHNSLFDILHQYKFQKQVLVYQVRKGQKIYVLKRIKEQMIGQSQQVKACQKFKQDNDPDAVKYVVKCEKTWQSENQDYFNILMEWCDAPTLQQELQQDTIANQRPQLCVLYFLSILYGLTACHQKGIIHRDIKPDNVFFTHHKMRKQLKIGDFGVCTFQSRPDSLEGTDFFLAPQVYMIQNPKFSQLSQQSKKKIGLNEKKYNSICDLYSLGIISYLLYNGLDKYGNPTFPFVKYLLKKVKQGKDIRKLKEEYYSKSVDTDNFLKCWRIWKQISQQDRKRMQTFKNLIGKILNPDYLYRMTFEECYEFIKENRQILFHGLEDEPIIQDFDKYYGIEVGLAQQKQNKNFNAKQTIIQPPN